MSIVKRPPTLATVSSSPDGGVTIHQGSDEDYTQKCIRRSGLIQAAVQSPGAVAHSTSWEDYKNKVRELAEEHLRWVENHGDAKVHE